MHDSSTAASMGSSREKRNYSKRKKKVLEKLQKE
jgi:hypothetical protein